MIEGALLTAHVRRFKGNDTTPQYTKQLDWMRRNYAVRPIDLEKLYDEWEFISTRHNMILNSGRDYIHKQSYITPASTAVLQYIAVTTDTGAPAATDTTLASEIVDANGLARAQATTDTHSVGTNVSTIGITFTASGAYTAVQKGALFTANSGGTMANESQFSSTNLGSGDQLALSWAVTIG